MAESTNKLKQLTITYFEGINSKVSDHISEKEELSHGENVRSLKIGYLEKRKGTSLSGDALTSPSNYGLFYFNSDASNGLFRITNVSGTVSIYYLNSSDEWTALTGDGTGLSESIFDSVKANQKLFLVNGADDNRYIESDGATVITSGDSTGNLYKSPKANKITYYRDRLYVADYYIGSTRFPTGVMRSSTPLGLAALVNNDYESPVSGDKINVTETKYIYSSDSLDVYRGSNKVANIDIDEKGEDYIKLSSNPTFESGYSDILAVDELWPAGTHDGERVFRWATTPDEGVDEKRYDTFNLTGGGNDPITLFEAASGSLVMANKDNLALWNGSSLQPLDYGIGCVSKRGYVKAIGSLFFLHYTGIYMMGEKSPQLISSKVGEYIKGATKDGLENAVMGVEDKNIFCYLGNVTIYKDDNSIDKELEDVVLEYNIQQENWFVHTNMPVDFFAVDRGAVNPDKLYLSDKEDGHIYKAFSSLSDREGSTPKEIPANLTTSNIYLADSFERISYPKEIMAEIKSGSNIKCFVSMDDNPFIPLEGSMRKGCNILSIGEEYNKYIRGRKIRISLREMSDRAMKVSQIGIVYAETGEREKHND